MKTQQPSDEAVTATWIIELSVDCPNCNEHFDALETPDFWDGRVNLHPGMTGRYHDAAKDLLLYCPKCDHEFKVNCEY